jgi:hypothetical protein
MRFLKIPKWFCLLLIITALSGIMIAFTASNQSAYAGENAVDNNSNRNLALNAAASTGKAYYVDILNSKASDTNPGTETLPWKYCPGMTTEWQGGDNPLQPGDVVYFNNAGHWVGQGGDNYKYFLTLTGGVTYDGKSWGTKTGSQAKLSLQRRMIDNSGIVTIDEDHPTIPTVFKGFDVDGFAADATCVRFMPQVWGGMQDIVGATKRIEDCYIHDCGSTNTNWSYGIEVTARLDGKTDKSYTVSNVEIIGNVVERTRRGGIELYTDNYSELVKVSNILVRGNEVSQSGYQPDIITKDVSSNGCGIGMKNWVENVVVEYNYLHDQAGNEGWSTGALHFATGNIGKPHGTIKGLMRYNIISNNHGFGIHSAGNGIEDVTFLGNIIVNNGRSGVSIENKDRQGVKLKFYNNTIFNNGQRSDATIYGEIKIAGSFNYEQLELVNNIIYANTSGPGSRSCLYDAFNTNRFTKHLHNLYYRENGGELVNIANTSYNVDTLPVWESSAVADKPMFKDSSKIPVGFIGNYGIDMIPNKDGLYIASGVAANGGIDLGSKYNGAINFGGNSSLTRPQGEPWSLGAYQVCESPDQCAQGEDSPGNSDKPAKPGRLRMSVGSKGL